jgi:hypothetical protein
VVFQTWKPEIFFIPKFVFFQIGKSVSQPFSFGVCHHVLKGVCLDGSVWKIQLGYQKNIAETVVIVVAKIDEKIVLLQGVRRIEIENHRAVFLPKISHVLVFIQNHFLVARGDYTH